MGHWAWYSFELYQIRLNSHSICRGGGANARPGRPGRPRPTGAGTGAPPLRYLWAIARI
ncbi:MAG: hypothetical protein F6J93_33425 [Oscillatoria sp. SIO1A7]|nr:hypothetical protein [Oscillatoria sp. SIO1A7]